MTAIPQSNRLLSDTIQSPLREVAHRQWVVLAAVGVLKALTAGLAALLAAALLLGFVDSLWMPVRIVVAALAWFAVIASAVIFLHPALRRWGLSRAAMQVEHHHPNLQERLSSAVELSDETDPRFRGSPALVDHLVRQAEADAAAVRPEQIVRNDPIVRWALYFVPVLLAWMLIALVPATTRTAMAGLYRVLMPWKNTLPAVLTRVSVKPGDVTITQGDPLDITARVSIGTASDQDAGHAILVRQFDNGQKLTEPMDKLNSRDFRVHFDGLQQSFSYQVRADAGDSAWFRATVHPRPTITSLDVRYDYPPYTGLSSTTESNKDGNIDALVGSRVTLTIHTALPVVLDKSHVVLDPGKPEELSLPMKRLQASASDYQVVLVLSRSGQYRINLTNEFDLTNKDEQPRTIVAQPDEVPTIIIQSPEEQITVRPDDTVPVKYLATDDFGVSKIEAILQIDDREPRTVPVKFKAADKRNVTGPAYRLSVADALSAQKISDADHIAYQLKVTDNRDPDPQSSYSKKQTLKINRNEPQSYASKLDQKLANDLREAIQKAIEGLDHNHPRVEQARNIDPKQALGEWQRKELQTATKELPLIATDLDKAADEAMNTPFDDIARTVRQIADNPVRGAADDTARAELNAESGQDRQEAAGKAVSEIVEARDALQKLLQQNDVQKDQQAADAARDLAEAARKQQEAADLMKSKEAAEQNPEARRLQDQAMQKQTEAHQKLQQAIDRAEPLRDPKAQQLAQALQNLIQNVENQEKQQQANAEQAEKHEAANQIQQNANDIAKQQEALNQDIQKTADQQKQPIQQAGANPPAKDQQDNIVKELNKNEIQQAHEAMKRAVDQLKQETSQLAELAKSNDVKPNRQQQDALNNDQKAAQEAHDNQAQANQAADALKQEAGQNAVPKSDDAGVQKAEQLAQAMAKQADALKQHAADSEKAAHDEAQAAQKAGDKASQEAAQRAEHAAHDAAQAAQAAQQDAQAAQKDAEQSAHAAAPQDAQKNLQQAAQDLQKAGQELAQAADKAQEASKGEMLAAQKNAAHHAGEEAHEEAQRQEALAKALEGDQQQLAQAQQNQQPLDQAAQQEGQLAEQTKAAAHQAQDLQKQANDNHDANIAHRAEQAQADLAQAEHHEGEAAKAEQQAQAAEHQAADAHDAEQAHQAEQHAAEALQQAGEHQQQAQQALTKAENALRDLPSQLAQTNDQAEGQHEAEQGQEQGQEPGDEHGEAHEHGQGHHPGSPAQEQQQAAQAAQEAREAQQEAGQQNPAAAQQAAQALAQAAQAMADAVPGSLHQADEAGDEAGHEPGQDHGPGNEASTTPGQTPDSRQGISIAAGGAQGVPASVRDIGITPDQWAKLPPMARKDLLNAAQQSGPPSYRQMIKDYYVRIARIQDSGAPARK